MESMLYGVDKHYRGNESYSGHAIHSYTYYKKLAQFGADSMDITPPSIIDVSFISDSSGSYFDFYVVDITGVGLDEEASLDGAKIYKTDGTSESELLGNWKTGTKNHLLFSPDSLNDVDGDDIYNLTPVDSSGNKTTIEDSVFISTTSVGQKTHFNPNDFNFYQNFPNPFNPATRIKFSLQKASKVSLKVFDVLGNEITVLVDDEKPAGNYEVVFDGKNISSGVYFFILNVDGNLQIRKMCLMK